MYTNFVCEKLWSVGNLFSRYKCAVCEKFLLTIGIPWHCRTAETCCLCDKDGFDVWFTRLSEEDVTKICKKMNTGTGGTGGTGGTSETGKTGETG